MIADTPLPIKVQALKSAYAAGLLTDEEFETKARDLAGEMAAAKTTAAQAGDLGEFLATPLGTALAAGVAVAWRVYRDLTTGQTVEPTGADEPIADPLDPDPLDGPAAASVLTTTPDAEG